MYMYLRMVCTSMFILCRKKRTHECDCCAVVFDPEPTPEDAADDDGVTERHCDSLIMCIVTTLNEGLRNGGGIGDVLRKPSSTVSCPALLDACCRCLSFRSYKIKLHDCTWREKKHYLYYTPICR